MTQLMSPLSPTSGSETSPLPHMARPPAMAATVTLYKREQAAREHRSPAGLRETRLVTSDMVINDELLHG